MPLEAENRELNSIRSGHRIVEFEDVDVSVPIELNHEGEAVSRQIVVRAASEKTVEQIHGEIEAARARHSAAGDTGQEDRHTLRLIRRMFLLPKFVRTVFLKRLIRDPFALGGVVRKPVEVGRRIAVREILSLSVFFNHDIVDGAPAARFADSLRKRIESAEVL